MAFNRSAFAPIGGQSSRGGAPQVYSYKHPTDTVTDMQVDGYFNGARTYLVAQDIIVAVGSDTFIDLEIVLVPLNGDVTVTVAAGGAGSGDVAGPASSTDNAIARFSGTTGKIIQNSGVTIDDNNLLTATKLIAGDPGTEGTGINIGGVTYESTFKVSDINGTNFAQTILHRHSTTLEPLIVGARNNSDTTTHTAITAGQNVFSIYGVGVAGSNYKLFGSVTIGADSTGSISDTSAPGRMTFNITPDASVTPAAWLTVTNDKTATFVGNINNSTLTASELVITDASKNLVSAPVATYPSLTELSYGKGVTSGIQSQLNAKAASGANSDITSLNTLSVKTAGSAYFMPIVVNDAFTADRTLNIKLFDADRTLTLKGEVTFEGNTDVSTYANTYLSSASEAAFKAAVNLEIGVDVQAYDANTAKLNVAQVFTKAQGTTPVALTSTSNAVAVDASLSNKFTHVLTENTTVSSPSNLVDGKSYTFVFKQHASAVKTLAFNATFKFIDDANSTIPAAVDSLLVVSADYTTVGGLICATAIITV
jgi:hypothetical protein